MARHSATLLNHFFSPRNGVPFADPDAVSSADHGGQAPRIKFLMRFKDNRIEQIAFQTFGCGVAIAAGSVLTELVMGRSIAECGAITVDDVCRALDGVPEDRKYCVDVAVAALRKGLVSPVTAASTSPKQS